MRAPIPSYAALTPVRARWIPMRTLDPHAHAHTPDSRTHAPGPHCARMHQVPHAGTLDPRPRSHRVPMNAHTHTPDLHAHKHAGSHARTPARSRCTHAGSPRVVFRDSLRACTGSSCVHAPGPHGSPCMYACTCRTSCTHACRVPMHARTLDPDVCTLDPHAVCFGISLVVQ